MAVLIFLNSPIEDSGTIEVYLKNKNIPYTNIKLYENEEIPDAKLFDTLVMMGGPMSVNDEKQFPFITEEIKIAKQFLLENKKVLGICLGAQIMAKALGEKVYKGDQSEKGWFNIELTPDGLRDSLMIKLCTHPNAGYIWKKLKVFQWHGETFDIPEKAVKLAKSEFFPNQCFKFGKNAYAFQFHIEMTRQLIQDWMENEPCDIEKITEETEKFYEIYSEKAQFFYKAFFKE